MDYIFFTSNSTIKFTPHEYSIFNYLLNYLLRNLLSINLQYLDTITIMPPKLILMFLFILISKTRFIKYSTLHLFVTF